MKKIYITTPIFYVNDLPHIGHAYTSIICDTIYKFYQLNGFDVLFTTGTDEHGLKVEKAANSKKVNVKDFVDSVSKNFKNLTFKLQLSNTDFVRTTEERHKNAALFFWDKLETNNQIYLSKYKGWYSIKDESFYQEKELEKINNEFYTSDGEKVEWIEEESYFFKLSNWENKLLDYYKNNPNFIMPDSRRNEVISFVSSGLKDLSISRTSFKWGITVKNTKNHIMYVWIDALVNYLTSLGYPSISDEKKEFWKNCIHIIGKDILKFHAVYWPAMLMAENLPIPKTIFAHGWWTNEGKKISKSLGNTIDPNKIIEEYGLDQFKYFLLREVNLGNDGDYSKISFLNRINADLSNNLGNLIQRTLKFLNKNFNSTIPYSIIDSDTKIQPLKDGYDLLNKVDEMMKIFQISFSLKLIFDYITSLNKFMDREEPWNSFKNNPKKTGKDLAILIEGFRLIGIILQPFIPNASSKILDTININKNLRSFKYLNKDHKIQKGHFINEPKPIFPRYETKDC